MFQLGRLWKEVTYNLKVRNIEEASKHKHGLEQRQRDEAKQRKEDGTKWETKVSWQYSSPSILQPSILRPPLIIRPLDLVPKGNFLC